MKKPSTKTCILLIGLCMTVSARGAVELTVKKEISLEALPVAVKTAAQEAVPGIELDEAEQLTRGAVTRYEVEGKAQGKTYELLLDHQGKVLEVVVEQDDDDSSSSDDESGDNSSSSDDDSSSSEAEAGSPGVAVKPPSE